MKTKFHTGKAKGEQFVQSLPNNVGYSLGYAAGFTLGMFTGTGKAIASSASKITPASVKTGFRKATNPQPEVQVAPDLQEQTA